MYKVYDGNTGRVRWVDDAPQGTPVSIPPQPMQQTPSQPTQQAPSQPMRQTPPQTAYTAQPQFSPLMDKLMKIIPGTIGELESEDIILLLILYLMYRESGDQELLMIMGGYLL